MDEDLVPNIHQKRSLLYYYYYGSSQVDRWALLPRRTWTCPEWNTIKPCVGRVAKCVTCNPRRPQTDLWLLLALLVHLTCVDLCCGVWVFRRNICVPAWACHPGLIRHTNNTWASTGKGNHQKIHNWLREPLLVVVWMCGVKSLEATCTFAEFNERWQHDRVRIHT